MIIDKEQANSAPDFSLNDSEGHIVRLSEFQGNKNVLLVFNRGFT
jgi:peroxiredoxin